MVWRISHVTAMDETIHDAMPYPSKEEAINQARGPPDRRGQGCVDYRRSKCPGQIRDRASCQRAIGSPRV
jgi:hypothetical protein